MNPLYAVLIAFLVLVALVSVPQSTQDAPHSAYQDASRGLGHLFEQTPDLTYQGQPVRTIHGQVKALEPRQEALLIVGPRTSFSDTEVVHIELFLRQGGRVLIADDEGTGRGLLDRLDIDLHIPEGRIFSTSYQGDASFPVTESTDVLATLPATVVLHEPRPVLGSAGQTLLLSHPLTWLDRNNDGRPDLDEPRGAFPLAKLVHLGAGQLVVIGDPDILTPRLQEANGGPQVQEAFMQWLTQGGSRILVVDEGHRATADPLGVAPLLAGDAPLRAALIVVAALAATFLVAFKVRVRRIGPNKKPQAARPTDAWERAVLGELPRR